MLWIMWRGYVRESVRHGHEPQGFLEWLAIEAGDPTGFEGVVREIQGAMREE
jgi:hypothetical protein